MSPALDAAVAPARPAVRRVAGKGYEGWVVEFSADPSVESEHWSLSDSVVADIEKVLPDAIAAAHAGGKLVEASADLLARLPSYVRRYEPSKTGLVDIGLYCPTAAKRAAAVETRVGDIKGGGDCYLAARYDLDQGILWVRSNAQR